VSNEFVDAPPPDSSESGAAFREALHSFKKGDTAYGDFLAQIDRWLATGTAPAQLLNILRASENPDALPRDVFTALADRIANWPLTLAKGPARFADAPTIVLGADADGAARDAAVAVALRAPVAGETLKGRFQLVELIGEGGMSCVYKALDLRRVEARSQDPFIAVKVLTLPFHEYFGSIAALQSEAQKLQSLSHPNILRVFDCDRDGETVFMTMEYIEGTRLLAGQISQGPPSGSAQEAATAIILAIGSALDYAHRNNIAHGDLKPGNVIVTARGEVKVIDFGLARWIAHPGAGHDAPAPIEFAATRRYASPQVLARKVPEPSDDVYALACIAYQLFTGTHPFGDDEAWGPRVLPPERPGLTSRQYGAILKALHFERRDRTATVREFIDEFTAARPVVAWRKYAIAGGVAALLGMLLWIGKHPSTPTHAGPTPAPQSPPASSPSAPEPGSVIRDCPTCPFMTVLPSGRFEQGSASGGSSAPFEAPRHAVSIGSSIAMSTTDVTVAEFREFATATGRDLQGCDTYDGEWRHRPNASWTDPGFTQGTTHPVTCVSWNDAVAYAQWLSTQSGHRYRLPSASEWEYAARAGGDERPWKTSAAGACADANVADQSAARRYPGWTVFPCDDGYVNTAPVGSFKANAFGLNDMLGNVFQWTEDCWQNDYTGAPVDGSARQDGDCAEREMRGGSWFSSPDYVSASYRNHFAAGYRTSSVGFRLVREINP
jgi:formylglycine-generating enzyme required for sulfatase activity/predicted Ser/Thr protein kinase